METNVAEVVEVVNASEVNEVVQHSETTNNDEVQASSDVINDVDVAEASEVVDNVEVMLTTFDNPYDPFDEFVPWFLFDVSKGYYSCNLLARIARSSDEFSTIEDKRETEIAIDKIIDNDFLNIYTKVTRKIEEEQV